MNLKLINFYPNKNRIVSDFFKHLSLKKLSSHLKTSFLHQNFFSSHLTNLEIPSNIPHNLHHCLNKKENNLLLLLHNSKKERTKKIFGAVRVMMRKSQK